MPVFAHMICFCSCWCSLVLCVSKVPEIELGSTYYWCKNIPEVLRHPLTIQDMVGKWYHLEPLSTKLPMFVAFELVTSQGIHQRPIELFERGNLLYIFTYHKVKPLRVLPVSVVYRLSVWATLVEVWLQGLPYLVLSSLHSRSCWGKLSIVNR